MLPFSHIQIHTHNRAYKNKHTHTRTNTHTHTVFLTLSHSLSLTHSHTLSLSFSLSHSLLSGFIARSFVRKLIFTHESSDILQWFTIQTKRRKFTKNILAVYRFVNISEECSSLFYVCHIFYIFFKFLFFISGFLFIFIQFLRLICLD